MEFLFGVLGSVIFWLIYGVGSVAVGTWSLKKYAPKVFEYIKTNGKEGDTDPIDVFICITFHMLFWYLPIIAYGIYWILKTILWQPIRKTIMSVDKATPDISIKVKKNETEE